MNPIFQCPKCGFVISLNMYYKNLDQIKNGKECPGCDDLISNYKFKDESEIYLNDVTYHPRNFIILSFLTFILGLITGIYIH